MSLSVARGMPDWFRGTISPGLLSGGTNSFPGLIEATMASHPQAVGSNSALDVFKNENPSFVSRHLCQLQQLTRSSDVCLLLFLAVLLRDDGCPLIQRLQSI